MKEKHSSAAERAEVSKSSFAQDAETKTVLDSVAANIDVEVQQQAETDVDAVEDLSGSVLVKLLAVLSASPLG